MFVTTHYMDEAARCNSLAYIYLSKLLVSGSPQKMKSDQRVTPAGSRWIELQTEHPGLSWKESDELEVAELLGQVAENTVANIVDPMYTVVAKFPKRYLPEPVHD